ncbi:MAG: lysophospholipid acyltransferase family protein [Flavobacteriales bacterium]
MISNLLTHVMLFLIKGLSYLPFSVLYAISDFLYFLIYRVFKYRLKVVRGNIKSAFPNKTDGEIKSIEQGFYRHLCDLIVESVKLFSISANELNRRFKTINPEHTEAYFNQGKSLIGVTGHYNSWEMLALSLNLHHKHQAMGIYKKIKNPVMNKAMIKSRGKFDIILADTKHTNEMFDSNKNQVTITGFVADQWPSNIHKCYWTLFLGRETAVSYGTEHYARKYDMGVVFAKIRKVKRGFYEAEYITIADDVNKFQPGEITKAHTKALENLILEDPQYWVWSHKRWKRERPEEVPMETVFAQ